MLLHMPEGSESLLYHFPAQQAGPHILPAGFLLLLLLQMHLSDLLLFHQEGPQTSPYCVEEYPTPDFPSALHNSFLLLPCSVQDNIRSPGSHQSVPDNSTVHCHSRHRWSGKPVSTRSDPHLQKSDYIIQ